MPRLFLGNLGHDCRQRDIERLFEGFGELRNINLKGQYGFIEVESKEDASDAVRKVNGSNFNGGRIRVELANACSDGDPGSRDRDSGSRARVSDGRYRRTNYRIIVRNLSSRTSWQLSVGGLYACSACLSLLGSSWVPFPSWVLSPAFDWSSFNRC